MKALEDSQLAKVLVNSPKRTEHTTFIQGHDTPVIGGNRNVRYHLKTLWLFTKSDMKSMVYPNIIFGCVGAWSGVMSDSASWPSIQDTIANVVTMFVWLWANLLLFCVANQRLEPSIVEDTINKPWRPIPAGRIATDQARMLLMGLIPLVLVLSYFQGVLHHSMGLLVLTWMYNDLGGSDDHYLSRNLLNAKGMALYSGGALQIAVGKANGLNSHAVRWVGVIALVAFSTVQVQDLRDQAGDRLKGRMTLPLSLGDTFTRRVIAATIFVWSIGAPSFWTPHMLAYFPSVLLGCVLAARLMLWRDRRSDQRSWTLWSVWMVSIYMAPLLTVSTS